MPLPYKLLYPVVMDGFFGAPELPGDMDPDEALDILHRPWEYNFRQNMKSARVASGISQTQFAKQLNEAGLPYHQQTVQRVEDGKRPVRLNEAFVIAQALEVDISVLLKPATIMGINLDVQLNRLTREAKTLLNEELEGREKWYRQVHIIFQVTLPPVLDAIASGETPSEHTLWCWAVTIKLSDLLMSQREALLGLADTFDDPDTPGPLYGGLLWTGYHYGYDSKLIQDDNADLDRVRDPHQTCLEDVTADSNPFTVARSRRLPEIINLKPTDGTPFDFAKMLSDEE